MRLIILTQYFPPEVGAPQNRLYELALRLQKKGVEIVVLTAMPNYPHMEVQEGYRYSWYKKEIMDGMTVHRSWIFVRKSKSVLPRLLNYFSFVFSSLWVGTFRLKKSDWLLCESPPLFLGISAYLLSRFKRTKLIFNVSDLWPESAEKLGIVTNKTLLGIAGRLERFMYKKSALITGQTQGIVADIKKRFPEKRIYWLPNGVDTTYYTPMPIDLNWRKENGFSETDILLLYAGIIGHAQGLEILIHAAAKIQHPRVKFILLGEGPEKKRLIEMKEEQKLSNIFFLSAVPKSKMPVVVSSCDIAVIPLRKLDLFLGAIPSKIFESIAMQKPILLGVAGEAKDLFIDEAQAGLAFEPENVDDLIACIERIVKEPELVKTLSQNGRNYAIRKFERDQIASAFMAELNTQD